MQSGTKTAIDQKRFVSAARVGLLKSCNVDWWGCIVERRYLCRVGCGISSIRDIRIASETSRRSGSGTARPAPACEASTVSGCATAPEIPAASAPSAAKTTAAKAAAAKTTSAGIRRKRADLQREINLSGIRCDLNFALLRRETEHSDFDRPCARGHIGEFEIAGAIGERSKDAISLSSANCSSRQGLACRFHRAGLRQRQ